jgi:chloramphenicol 3-O phosphotransferase
VGQCAGTNAGGAPIEPLPAHGQIIVLNGAPRSGKSSIAAVVQDTFDGAWMNLGVDAFVRAVTPRRYQPGMGLRPGEPQHAAAPLVPVLYAAMYESIAAHSRLGLNVVVDVGHHGGYGDGILADCARRVAGLPVLFVGVRCPIEVIMKRRNAGQPGREGQYAQGTTDEPIPPPVLLWQRAVHVPGIYDLEVDTSLLSADECAAAIRARLCDGPPGAAFRQLAGRT